MTLLSSSSLPQGSSASEKHALTLQTPPWAWESFLTRSLSPRLVLATFFANYCTQIYFWISFFYTRNLWFVTPNLVISDWIHQIFKDCLIQSFGCCCNMAITGDMGSILGYRLRVVFHIPPQSRNRHYSHTLHQLLLWLDPLGYGKRRWNG
jgi:hypothetical protein